MINESAATLERVAVVGGLPTSEPDDAELLRRFARDADEAAFAHLVHRHGPMVYGLCRRVLRHRQEAEDAFQATFLVLVRKCGSIGQPALLANWLYGVAYRVASRARMKLQTRAFHESRSGAMLASRAGTSVDFAELERVLDDEIRALPEKYRTPLVLCYLEGKTHAEAARILGSPTGSMSGRVARGLQLLRARLSRRGTVLSVAALMLWLSRESQAAVPSVLVDATVHAGVHFAVGESGVSESVAQLVRETLARPAAAVRWAVALALALLVVLALGGGDVARKTLASVVAPKASSAEARARFLAAYQTRERECGARPPWENGCAGPTASGR